MKAAIQPNAVYGVILNDQTSLQTLQNQLTEPPYKAPPQQPVLYIKPRNTWVPTASTIYLPPNETHVEVAASIGLLIKQPTSRVSSTQAEHHIAGLVAVADLSLPHSSYYRPAIREKCFDGACPMANQAVPLNTIKALAEIELRTFINDQQVAHRRFGDWVRSPAQLLSDVTAFMQLNDGDMLLSGVPYQAPQAQQGDQVRIEIEQVGSLTFRIAAQGEQAA